MTVDDLWQLVSHVQFAVARTLAEATDAHLAAWRGRAHSREKSGR
jgi:hypothetical protein